MRRRRELLRREGSRKLETGKAPCLTCLQLMTALAAYVLIHVASFWPRATE